MKHDMKASEVREMQLCIETLIRKSVDEFSTKVCIGLGTFYY